MEGGALDLPDSRLYVRVVGQHRDLKPGERPRLVSHFGEGDRKKPDGDLLAGRRHHVELALVGHFRELLRQPEQPVRLPRHRGNHDDHVVPLVVRLRHAPGDVLDLFYGPDGRAAVLLDNERHLAFILPGQEIARETGIRRISRRSAMPPKAFDCFHLK